MEKYKDGDMQQIHARLWNTISDYSKKGGEQVIHMICSAFSFLGIRNFNQKVRLISGG
ncbi:hypothetical protein [Peribacillus simplex]|uniref:hypothetical protein n=1 Tax=Peribacillus simplex TaxID=1478 RepID=UPI003D27D5DD